jgi:hypothetical protein
MTTKIKGLKLHSRYCWSSPTHPPFSFIYKKNSLTYVPCKYIKYSLLAYSVQDVEV